MAVSRTCDEFRHQLGHQVFGVLYEHATDFRERSIGIWVTDEDSFGLFERMEATGNTAEVELVTENFATARAAAMAEDREGLAAAIGLLDGNLKREVPDALGVELGLTFTDGD